MEVIFIFLAIPKCLQFVHFCSFCHCGIIAREFENVVSMRTKWWECCIENYFELGEAEAKKRANLKWWHVCWISVPWKFKCCVLIHINDFFILNCIYREWIGCRNFGSNWSKLIFSLWFCEGCIQFPTMRGKPAFKQILFWFTIFLILSHCLFPSD